ncbi:flagella synthesis protein FlgN [Vibrio salinus]|uniref:flagella synthesis protein FlgN n=1 Tax=Vibrio salinus TaxID=2899784 RepID=UPI001E4560C8|nr:flagellar export chaperone FlgN [Vibrio salinus]MCE0494435.1 flagellar export chaperone FlgN [Vibrio salinus]
MAVLTDLLDFQLHNAQELLALLENEKVAIATRVSADIESIAQKKIQLVEQLNTTDQRLANHPDVKSLTDDDDLRMRVDKIKETVAVCQQANDINGQALERAQISFRKLKNLMQQSQGKTGMTYSSDGKTSNISTLGTNLKV